MTPAGMIFTSLNVNKGKKGYENDNAMTVARRIIKEKGIMGLFYGGGPMCLRQASNWASRAGFTEICRTNLRMSQYGIWGEIGSGVIGGGEFFWRHTSTWICWFLVTFMAYSVDHLCYTIRSGKLLEHSNRNYPCPDAAGC